MNLTELIPYEKLYINIEDIEYGDVLTTSSSEDTDETYQRENSYDDFSQLP